MTRRFWSKRTSQSHPQQQGGGRTKWSDFGITLSTKIQSVADFLDQSSPMPRVRRSRLNCFYIEYVERVHLNDLSRTVQAFWRSALEFPDDLCKLVWDTPVTVDEWKRQKAVQTAPDLDTLALGFSTFFLKRTNRTAVLAGGMIGARTRPAPGNWIRDSDATIWLIGSRKPRTMSHESRSITWTPPRSLRDRSRRYPSLR
jgi:DNA adenine methylase